MSHPFCKATIFAVLLLLPIAAFPLVGAGNFHWFLSILYTATAAAVLIETVSGVPARQESDYLDAPLYPCTALIVAYLPNEADIVIDTLRHFRDLGEYEQILLAYNTPKTLPVESEIGAMAGIESVRVPDSHSKAENINYALKHYVGCGMVAIFDTDHRPEPGGVAMASYWLRRGYAAVQGRCLIRGQRRDRLSGTVGVEFDSMYRLLHNSRFNLIGTGIFGGSNCYWSTSAIAEHKLRPVLTEDIDLSLRAILAGEKIAYDPNIRSSEEAPYTVQSLWKQRVRWAMGWAQCTAWHTVPLLRSKYLRWWQKAYWFYQLPYREAFTVLAFSIYFVLAVPHQASSGFFLGSAEFGVMTAALGAIVIRFSASTPPGYRSDWLLFLATFIPYSAFKSLVSVMAWTRLIVRDKRWQCTQRTLTN